MDFKFLFDFLTELSLNNNKEWFDANRPRYETIKKSMLALATQLIAEISTFDSTIQNIDPKSCVFRINRDVRFSKDKSPYKTNLGIYIAKGGKKSVFGGYYLHLSPNDAFLATGLWMPMPPQLKAIRQEIDYNFATFDKIMKANNCNLYLSSEIDQKVSGMPKGYDKSNPAAEYLKYKSFVLLQKLKSDDFYDDFFLNKITHKFKEFKPFLDFINHAVEE